MDFNSCYFFFQKSEEGKYGFVLQSAKEYLKTSFINDMRS